MIPCNRNLSVRRF